MALRRLSCISDRAPDARLSRMPPFVEGQGVVRGRRWCAGEARNQRGADGEAIAARARSTRGRPRAGCDHGGPRARAAASLPRGRPRSSIGRVPKRRRARAPSLGEQARAREVVERLEREMPEARIALAFQDDVQLLVSVILSAQSTDARVNQISPALFERFPGAASSAEARPEE